MSTQLTAAITALLDWDAACDAYARFDRDADHGVTVASLRTEAIEAAQVAKRACWGTPELVPHLAKGATLEEILTIAQAMVHADSTVVAS